MLLLTIIKVHLVQLLRFLLDAYGQCWGAAVLPQRRLPSVRHLALLLGPRTGPAKRLGRCHTVGRGERSVGRGGRLRGRGGGRAAGLVEAGLLVAPGGLLDDGDVRGRRAGGKALGERRWRQVVQLGTGARGGGGQRGRLGCQSLLANGVRPAGNAWPEVRGHHRGHDLRGEVRLGMQGQGVLVAHEGSIVVVVRLRLYCRN